MKRYRVLSVDFDSRAAILAGEISDTWDEDVKAMERANQDNILQGLAQEYGPLAFDQKVQNFIDLGSKAFSVLAFHNKFHAQIRHSFVTGGYYPALTGACALGERILNHLMHLLRDDFKSSPEYKKVYRKESFALWEVPIDALSAWGVLLPEVADKFRTFSAVRNRAVHFHPDTDKDDRVLALEAIHLLNDIISGQFAFIGKQPWFLIVPGESYIKKEAEMQPFVRRVYLPNAALVGPKHTIEFQGHQILVRDNHPYEDREVTDEEFCLLRRGKKAA